MWILSVKAMVAKPQSLTTYRTTEGRYKRLEGTIKPHKKERNVKAVAA